MTAPTSIDFPVKPRVLIADDSRIVRAMLIKHIEGMFEFREALDGEQAWETLLLDPSIRVVITDLTMPKLDGYGLLQRIRSSKVSRIRNIPVIVISGSDEQQERERAKAAGATELITKGIGTAQLLSQLDVLSGLVSSQGEFERSLEALVRSAPDDSSVLPASFDALKAQAETLLANAIKSRKNFLVLNVLIGSKRIGAEDVFALPPAAVVEAVGRLLQRTVRQTDYVTRSGDAEFMLATGGMSFDSARFFAQRVCQAIANASLAKDKGMAFMASCGLISLSGFGAETTGLTLDAMCAVARGRAALGLERGVTGVVGPEEEAALRRRG